MRNSQLLFGVCGALATAAIADPTANPNPGGNLQIGSFDITRGGHGSLASGRYDSLKASILGAFPGAEFSVSGELTANYLSGVDVLVVSAVYLGGGTGIAPLTDGEQSALRDWVESGGTGVLLGDNSVFAEAAQSLLDPFQMTIEGSFGGEHFAVVDDPDQHAVTYGPYGTVRSMRLFVPGELTDTGPTAEAFASIETGGQTRVVGAIIEPGTLAPESGLLLAFSDSNILFDAYRSADATVMVLNALHLTWSQRCRVDVSGDGTVDSRDVLQFLGAWVLDDPAADWDGNGEINTIDFIAFLSDWVAGC